MDQVRAALLKAFLVAVEAFAIKADAALACKPRVWVYSAMFRAFMWAFSPKSTRLHGLRPAFAAQHHRQAVQRLPGVGGPVGLFEALDDAVHLVRGVQQTV